MTALWLTNLTEAQIADALGFEDQDESTTLVFDEEDDVLVTNLNLGVPEVLVNIEYHVQRL